MRRDFVRRTTDWSAAALLAALALFIRLDASEVSFTNEVMAVLSRAGCNQGVCHGNKNGKAGFKLSLRGQDPDFDHLALTREAFGRRVSLAEPDKSLILLKPTVQVTHEGGKRFEIGSAEYEMLRKWIACGASGPRADEPRLVSLDVEPGAAILVEPEDRLQLEVTATFSDGARRDVRGLAVYENANLLSRVSSGGLIERMGTGDATVLVRYLHFQAPVRIAFVPARPSFVWSEPPAADSIDEHVHGWLRERRMNPSELSSDAVFLRRAFLDAIGLLPSAAEARAFLADAHPGKRARLIDSLLERSEFNDWWALRWSDLLRIEEKTLDRKGVQGFHGWIRLAIAEKMPLDRFARELIAARGSTYQSPATNFYRAIRDPVSRGEAAAQVFLGTRLQCAKCHNHPFDRWTQDDYYGWAALFSRVKYKVIENRRQDDNDSHEFKGEQIVYHAAEGELTSPRTGKPAPRRFLGAGEPDAGENPLDALARWMAGPENSLFARAQANRIWSYLLGRGIVDPVDDFRATNPAAIPGLLDALAKDLVENGFDLRHAVRTIMNSRTYQLSAEPNETNQGDETGFSRALVRRLSAEQLLDAMGQAMGVPLEFNGYPSGLRAAQVPGVDAVRTRDRSPGKSDSFLKIFGKPPRLMSCDCERSSESTMGQALQLISGPAIDGLLTRAGNRLSKLFADGRSNGEILDELYLAALCRPPAPGERGAALGHIEGSADRRQAFEDLAWSLLNAKEFLLRH